MSDALQHQGHHVGTEAILPFAEGSEGRIVHVRDVKNGKSCGCICPECKSPLVANQGRKKAWYFAHYSAGSCNPKKALETTLHRLAKQIIQERGQINLPPLIHVVDGHPHTIHPGGLFRPSDVALEVSVPGMRPDIVARLGAKTLFIEIAVWNKVGHKKQKLLVEKRHSTIEIDLKEIRHETDMAMLERQILCDAPREWLFNTKLHDREIVARRVAEVKAAKLRARQEAIGVRILEDLVAPPTTIAPDDSLWARDIRLVEDVGFGHAIGISIDGDCAFSVGSRIWQAMILATIIRSDIQFFSDLDFEIDHPKNGLVRDSVASACVNKDRNWSLIEEITNGRVRSPLAVLKDYLDLLVCQKILLWRTPTSVGRSPDTLQRIPAHAHQAEEDRSRSAPWCNVSTKCADAADTENVELDQWLDIKKRRNEQSN